MKHFSNESFTFKGIFCDYTNCKFLVSRYNTNNNLYLGIHCFYEDGHSEPVCHCTVNTSTALSDDRIAVKDYSENEGMEDFLIRMGIIECDPIDYIISGCVSIGVFKLTDKGKELFKDVDKSEESKNE